MQAYLISALLFALLVALFAIQNTEQVVIKFLTFQFPISLVLVVLGSAITGALTLYFLGLFKQVGSYFKLRQLAQQKTELEEQLKNLETKIAELEKEKQRAVLEESLEKEEISKPTLAED